jgi:hypothetical protein
MSLPAVSTFRTLAIVVVLFVCGLAGSLLTPRFRAGPPADQAGKQNPDQAAHVPGPPPTAGDGPAGGKPATSAIPEKGRPPGTK